jgi:predicted deacylase
MGYWLWAIGYWLLAIGYWLLAIGYWLLAIGYWLLLRVTSGWMQRRASSQSDSEDLMRFLLATLALAGIVRPGIAQRPDPHATVTVGTATARRGEAAFGAIVVPAGIDSGYSIPVALVNGARPGPVLALIAGSHGTEYASIIALAQLIGRLDPKSIAGTVIVIPLVNVASFEQKVPHLNPIDRKNMNRFYPGNPTGTQSERASYLITREVVEQSDHLIDLHGGDLDESLRPYSYWTVTGNAQQDSSSKAMALAFGLDHIIISTERPKDPAASRYLENTATTRGKPSITVEAGYAGTVMPADVDALLNGCLNVMGHLKMLERPVRPVAKPVWIERLVTVTSDSTGIFYPDARRDQRVAAGTRLGYVTDYLGRKLFDVTTPEAGLILYLNALPTILKGGTVASIGVSAKAP